MKTKYTLQLGGLFLFLLFMACSPDNRRTPQPNNPLREYVFIDEFQDDVNEWSFADPANLAYGVVSRGTFKFDYNDDYYEAYYLAKFIGFNPHNNFSIEAGIGSDNNMGILFGFDDEIGAYGYSFMVDYDGYYALYDEGGNGYGAQTAELIKPRTGNFVNPDGDWNDVKILQRGSRWIGYVNDVQVFDIEAQKIRGSGIGYINVAQTRGESDYLEVHWYDY